MYGAILIEYRLETPEELSKDPRSLAFQNFYLSRRRLPSDLVSRALSVVPKQAHIREIERGVYVSMSREYNAEARGVDAELAQRASVSIGSVIGEGMSGSGCSADAARGAVARGEVARAGIQQ